MSKIKNGRLEQYGTEPFERQRIGTASAEGVKCCLLCTFSYEVMSNGAAECRNGHRSCVQCAANCAALEFGMRPVKWSSALYHALSWSGCTCCICGVRGPLRQSAVVDAAVAALPVRCQFISATGVSCRWTGRRDQFDSHRHVFTDRDQAQSTSQHQPPRRGGKRPSCDWNGADSDEAGAKRVRRQPDVVPTAATMPGDGAAATFRDADGEVGGVDVRPRTFDEVQSTLRNAGIIPKPAIPAVDKAAKIICDYTVRAVRRVFKAFKPSAS